MTLDIKDLANTNHLLIKISKDKSLTLQHTQVATSCWEVVNQKLLESFEDYTQRFSNYKPINLDTDILIQCRVPFDSVYFEGDSSNISNWKARNEPRILYLVLPRKYKKLLLSKVNGDYFSPYYDMNYKLTEHGEIAAVQITYMKGKTKIYLALEQLIYNAEVDGDPFDSVVEVRRVNSYVLDFRLTNVELVKALKPAGIQRIKARESRQVETITISNSNLNYIDPNSNQESKSSKINKSGYYGLTIKRNKFGAQFRTNSDKVWNSSLLESAYHTAIIADAYIWAHQTRIKDFQLKLNFPDNKPCVVCPCPACANLNYKSISELYTPEYLNSVTGEL